MISPIAKYVFKGIAEFTHNPPVIVTGDNWDDGKGVRGSDLFDSPIINIFNVDKINRDQGRIRKMQEYIGGPTSTTLLVCPISSCLRTKPKNTGRCCNDSDRRAETCLGVGGQRRQRR